VANTANVVTVTANLASVAGNIVATGNAAAGNLLTAGFVSAAGNITTAGNINLSGNIVDTGALSIVTGSNGNISLAPNGTGNVLVTGNLSATGTIRDSLGPVRTMLSGQTIVPDTSINISSGTSADVASFTLPAAGTYLVNYNCRVRTTSSAGVTNWGTVYLTENNNNVILDTRMIAQFFTSNATVSEFQTQVGSAALLTVTAATTYKMRVTAESGPIAVISDGAGRCKVVWAQISV